MKNPIAQVVVGLPVEGPFDYTIDERLRDRIALGKRVWIPFRNRRRLGFVVGFRKRSPWKKLKPILSVLDPKPILDSRLLQLTQEVSRYYGCSWGEAIEAALPSLLRKGRKLEREESFSLDDQSRSVPEGVGQPPPFCPRCFALRSKATGAAGAAPPRWKPTITLLHDQGTTRRWPFIIENIKEVIAQGRTIIFLVPEASLMDLVISQLKAGLGEAPVIWNKRRKPKDELKEWLMLKSGRGEIVVGTRSAVFAPLSRLGLIILYEEENPAYKQEQSPFYHARQVAEFRLKIEGTSVLLVSSAPSAEVWYRASRKKIGLISLTEEKLCPMDVIDLSNYKSRKAATVSFSLRNQIEETLKEKGKVLLWMNRRGFSRLTRCPRCGYTFQCPRCDVNLSYSYAKKKLICPQCDFRTNFPAVCPQCQDSHLRSIGGGIEKLESEMSRIFPQARISRYDRETQRPPEKFDILVGTQAVGRLKALLAVHLIGCVQIDAQLNRPDFRASQRVFSILIHLRQWAQKRLVVQTRLSDHYCFQGARRLDFQYFYKHELKARRELGLPPFRHLLAIGVRAFQEEAALQQAYSLYSRLKEFEGKEAIDIVEPHPDLTPKLRDQYRFTMILKGKSVRGMLDLVQAALKGLKRKKGVVIALNVDY